MIPVHDVKEGAKIATLAADLLLATSHDLKKGPEASALRRLCGDLKAYAETYIVDNVIAGKLSDCFDQARKTGATLNELIYIRERFIAEPVISLTAMLLKNGSICFSLQQMATVIVGMQFASRQDVERIRDLVNAAFDPAEEVAADEMALTSYKALISLHAAVTFYLYEIEHPLPQMLWYRFAIPRPTLVLSHRLYDTASRADQLREENRIVHPAFAPREGQALAF